MEKKIINGYQLETNLDTNNAGNCKWGFARKDGKRYFIKEFLDPVYPSITDGLADRIVERKKKICENYEKRQTELYDTINTCSCGGLQHITEFFRYGSHYYLTMEAIDELDRDVIADESFTEMERIRVCRLLVHNLACLHRAGVIHGDIKLDNIVLYRLPEHRLSARIIDFDDAFKEEDSPLPGDEVHGDQVYMAPETFRLMCGEDVRLTPAIDTFALGLLLYQILTRMDMPVFDKRESTYAFEALLEGQKLRMQKERLPEPFRTLVPKMLAASPEERISLIEADEILHEKQAGKAMGAAPFEILDPVPGLIIGRGFEKVFRSVNTLEEELKKESRTAWKGKVKEDEFFSDPGNLGRNRKLRRG